MERRHHIAALLLAPLIAMSAAAPAGAATEWVRIGPGPGFDYARAYCDNASMGVGQGYWAYGSQAYVAGVALAYGIGNLIQQSKYFHNCMAMQGWKKVKVVATKSTKSAKSGKSSKSQATQPVAAQSYQPPARQKLPAACANAKTMAELQKYCG